MVYYYDYYQSLRNYGFMTGSYRANTKRSLSSFRLFITRQSLLPVTPFSPDLPSKNDLGYLGFLGYVGYSIVLS